MISWSLLWLLNSTPKHCQSHYQVICSIFILVVSTSYVSNCIFFLPSKIQFLSILAIWASDYMHRQGYKGTIFFFFCTVDHLWPHIYHFLNFFQLLEILNISNKEWSYIPAMKSQKSFILLSILILSKVQYKYSMNIWIINYW